VFFLGAKPGVAEEIAQFTVDETQLGNYQGKFLKISVKTRATLQDIIHDKSVGVIEELPERNIVKIAKPVGVIGALSPSTNPEATPVIKAISAVKGRNAIVLAPQLDALDGWSDAQPAMAGAGMPFDVGHGLVDARAEHQRAHAIGRRDGGIGKQRIRQCQCRRSIAMGESHGDGGESWIRHAGSFRRGDPRRHVGHRAQVGRLKVAGVPGHVGQWRVGEPGCDARTHRLQERGFIGQAPRDLDILAAALRHRLGDGVFDA